MYGKNNTTNCVRLIAVLFFSIISPNVIDCSLNNNNKRHDICRPFGQKRIYTAIGSRGIVYAKNETFNVNSKLNVTIARRVPTIQFIRIIHRCRIVSTDNVLCTFFRALRAWSTCVSKTLTWRVPPLMTKAAKRSCAVRCASLSLPIRYSGPWNVSTELQEIRRSTTSRWPVKWIWISCPDIRTDTRLPLNTWLPVNLYFYINYKKKYIYKKSFSSRY